MLERLYCYLHLLVLPISSPSSRSIMIRIRHPQGSATFKVQESTTLKDLQDFIQTEAAIAPHEQELKLGYPPKVVHLSAQAATQSLTASGIHKGEQIIVTKRTGASTVSERLPSDPPLPQKAAQSSEAATVAAATTPVRQPAATPSRASSSTTTAKDIKDGSVVIPVTGDQGFLALKVVPDDNACLFNSVGFLFEHRIGSDVCDGLRQVVAEVIRGDPDSYPDVVLGQPRDSYISKILSPQTWGGAIELSILSAHFGIEIDSIDVASGTIHRFGEDMGYENRGIVIYSGIHYDALTLLPAKTASMSSGTTIFPSLSAFGIPLDQDPILQAAQSLVGELKAKRYYTDTSTFSLKCKTCGTKLTGQKEAIQHAKSTGHGDFGEV